MQRHPRLPDSPRRQLREQRRRRNAAPRSAPPPRPAAPRTPSGSRRGRPRPRRGARRCRAAAASRPRPPAPPRTRRPRGRSAASPRPRPSPAPRPPARRRTRSGRRGPGACPGRASARQTGPPSPAISVDLDPRPGPAGPRPPPRQPRRDHPGVVEHQQVARPQPVAEPRHRRVRDRVAARHQQPRRRPRPRRAQRDQRLGQREVEVREGQRVHGRGLYRRRARPATPPRAQISRKSYAWIVRTSCTGSASYFPSAPRGLPRVRRAPPLTGARPTYLRVRDPSQRRPPMSDIEPGQPAPAVDPAPRRRRRGQPRRLRRPQGRALLLSQGRHLRAAPPRRSASRERRAEFEAAGAVVIGVSKDSVKSHDKFRDKHGLGLILLSDEHGDVTERYGAWVEKSMYGKKYMGIDRSTFLIGADGADRPRLAQGQGPRPRRRGSGGGPEPLKRRRPAAVSRYPPTSRRPATNAAPLGCLRRRRFLIVAAWPRERARFELGTTGRRGNGGTSARTEGRLFGCASGKTHLHPHGERHALPAHDLGRAGARSSRRCSRSPGCLAFATANVAVGWIAADDAAGPTGVLHEAYRARLDALADERDQRAAEALSAQSRFQTAMEQIGRQQTALLHAVEERRELATALDLMREPPRRGGRRSATRSPRPTTACSRRIDAASAPLAAGASDADLTDTLRGGDRRAQRHGRRPATPPQTERAELAAELAAAELELKVTTRRQDEMVDELKRRGDRRRSVRSRRCCRRPTSTSTACSPRCARTTPARAARWCRSASAPGRFPATPAATSKFDELMIDIDRMNLLRIAIGKVPYAMPVQGRAPLHLELRLPPRPQGRRPADARRASTSPRRRARRSTPPPTAW